MITVDYLIIGGGIAGASIGYHLASDGSVIILEKEDQPGYHTTGRSAAFYAESYGGPVIRPLTSASKSFLWDPPSDFSEKPFIQRRGAIHIFSREDRMAAVEEARSAFIKDRLTVHAQTIPLRLVSRAEALSLQPMLAGTDFDGALLDEDCGDLDVAALHQAYLKGFSIRGGSLKGECELRSASYNSGFWTVETSAEIIKARIIINTAGAWADDCAARCGAAPLGLKPYRRTVITAAVEGIAYDAHHPLTLEWGEKLYFKPESGVYLLSPEDETLSPPCDSQPELDDIALTIDRFERFTGLTLGRPLSTWAGLRTFAPDRAPVIGYDKTQPGFFWNAGQGGYGIQTCPAWSKTAACLVRGDDLPDDLLAFGCDPADYSPHRLT